jgi:hypothetical protein
VPCTSDYDCPYGLGSCQENKVAKYHGSGFGKICVPENCDSGCPTLGALCNEATFGAVSGVCQNGGCDYRNGRMLARCVPPESRVRGKLLTTLLKRYH